MICICCAAPAAPCTKGKRQRLYSERRAVADEALEGLGRRVGPGGDVGLRACRRNSATPAGQRNRELQAVGIGGRIRRIAAPGRIGHVNIALISAAIAVVVGQAVPDDFAHRRGLGVEHQRPVVGRQKEIAVGVDPALESKRRAGKITEIAVGKNAELENRDERDFHAARHVDRGPAGTGRDHLQGQRNNFGAQAGVLSGADDAGMRSRIAVGVRCPE